MTRRQKASLVLLVFFYLVAGSNHFIAPDFYYPLIPDYIGDKTLVNVTAGVVELLLAFMVLYPKTRRIGAYGVILMLIAFIPSHVYFIQIGSCVNDGLCVAPWISWSRLLIIHPILIYWAYSVGRIND
jgi:uncharacterized membrane protein